MVGFGTIRELTKGFGKAEEIIYLLVKPEIIMQWEEEMPAEEEPVLPKIDRKMSARPDKLVLAGYASNL